MNKYSVVLLHPWGLVSELLSDDKVCGCSGSSTKWHAIYIEPRREGPSELDPQHLSEKPAVAADTCNPALARADTGRSMGFAASQPSWG